LISLTVGCKTVPAPSITPYSELVSPPERPYLAPIETIKDAGIRLTNTLSHIEKQEMYIKDMEGYYLEVIEIISR
jgi:hypothetical protein